MTEQFVYRYTPLLVKSGLHWDNLHSYTAEMKKDPEGEYIKYEYHKDVVVDGLLEVIAERNARIETILNGNKLQHEIYAEALGEIYKLTFENIDKDIRIKELEKLREEDMLAFESTQVRRDEQNLKLKKEIEGWAKTNQGLRDIVDKNWSRAMVAEDKIRDLMQDVSRLRKICAGDYDG